MPIIFIGNVRLRGNYLNTMFVAVAIDGNNQIVPIQFSLAMENIIDCCTCFIMKLREALREGRELLFISNVNDVVSSCIGHVFPDFYHGYTCKSVFMYICIRVCGNRTLEPFVLDDIQIIYNV